MKVDRLRDVINLDARATQMIFDLTQRVANSPQNHRLNMSRYKSGRSAKSVERDFPHFINIAVPSGGLGTG
jgi:hypothetical protein